MTIELDENALRIAPIGVSTSRCFNCDVYLTPLEQIDLYDRVGIEHACGYTLTDTLDTWTDVCPDSADFLDDTHVLASTWWHYTMREDWSEGLDQELLVHIGTERAAMARRQVIGGDTNDGWLYQLRLKPGTKLNSDILPDMLNAWPYLASEIGTNVRRDYRRYIDGANRYVNHIEAPGSISLLVPARDLYVVGCQDVPGDWG